MVRANAIKNLSVILVCVWIAISSSAIPVEQALAHTITPLENSIGEIGTDAALEKSVLQEITAVTLVNFQVEYISATGQVLVTWETATELDTAGYVVWRSTTEFGTYEAKSPFIQAEGGLTPMTYEWVDADAEMGNLYYYKLEEINTDNITVYFYGPVVFDFFSPTGTPTSTATSTPTGTITVVNSATPTPTSTRTPTRTSTLIFSGSTPTPTKTVTLAPSSSSTVVPDEMLLYPAPGSGTVTLVPLPPIQLLFPEATVTTAGEQLAMLQSRQSEVATVELPEVEMRANITGRIWLLGGIIFLLWIVLGIFLVAYLRKSQG